MAKAYTLQEKRYVQTDEEGYESLSAALLGLKKMIQKNCDINSELNAISNNRLPAPKYRLSVYRYLATFFLEDRFPSYKMIDYSDYEGIPREFDPDSFYEFDEFTDITDFEYKLGFVFSVGKKGMRLGFIRPNLMTYCFFKKYDDSAFFGIEYMQQNRMGLDARIFKSDKNLPPKLSGSFYPVLLLDILLKESNMCRINIPLEEVKNMSVDEEQNPSNCLSWRMEELLYAKMNQGFILPSKITFDEGTLEGYINLLKRFGYTVNKNEDKYYIPPFICKKDTDIILDCINGAKISHFSKLFLIEKFKSEIGYHRFSKDDFEESTMPMPFHRDKGDEWSAGYYSLIIYNLLRLCARPLPISSEKKESIQSLAEKYYGVEIDRKKAIPNNAAAMATMGLPIQKVDGKYCFDTSKLLSKDDMDALVKCISESNISESKKESLIKELDEKFPIGKY